VRGARACGACSLCACLLLGCAKTPPPSEGAEPAIAAAPIRLTPDAPREIARERDLCEVIAGLLAQEAGGFTRLRGQTIADERWAAETTVPGLGDCVIEGSAWPRARFVCASPRLQPDQAHARFDRLAARSSPWASASRPGWIRPRRRPPPWCSASSRTSSTGTTGCS
jgi:hypothetical protein